MTDWQTLLQCPNYPRCSQDGQPLRLQESAEPEVHRDMYGQVSGVTLHVYCNGCGVQLAGYVPVSAVTVWTKEDGDGQPLEIGRAKPRPWNG